MVNYRNISRKWPISKLAGKFTHYLFLSNCFLIKSSSFKASLKCWLLSSLKHLVIWNQKQFIEGFLALKNSMLINWWSLLTIVERHFIKYLQKQFKNSIPWTVWVESTQQRRAKQRRLKKWKMLSETQLKALESFTIVDNDKFK